MGGMARTAGVHPRLVKYISIIHPRVSGWAQGGAVRISVRSTARDNHRPGFGHAPSYPLVARPLTPHPLSDFLVEPETE